ncbi:FAD-dependent monooxygenase [Rhodoferax sp.]|uniref:FAD-dependent monooxygenase n=1 Tax=Rhodoferax sp. TaxID=50421 RepID=UPI0025E70B19|nr:FAD-dependent monooxygenase [Rhodoferax sp.]
MAQTYDICIRGAGIVGRTLALHLASKRLKVALVDNSSRTDESPDVRAYALNAQSRQLLEAIRCWPADAHATPVLHMAVMADAEAQVHFDAAPQGVEALNWIVDVPVLEQQLSQAVQFQSLISVVDTPQAASLTVVCEGRASATRDEFGIDFDTRRYAQWAVAARVESTLPHQQTARQWFHDGDITALLPMQGPDGNFHALVWSVSPDRARTLMHYTDTEFTDALQTATRMTVGNLRLASPRASWSLQHAVANRWVGTFQAQGLRRAWVLAGDAAHNVHPLAGQGLNLGLGDVAELVRVLDTRSYWRPVDDMRLLRQYERARKAAFAVVGGSGNSLQQLFTHPHGWIQNARSWGMRGFDSCAPLKHWVARQAMGL